MTPNYLRMAEAAEKIALYFDTIPTNEINMSKGSFSEEEIQAILEQRETNIKPCGCVGAWWTIKMLKEKGTPIDRIRQSDTNYEFATNDIAQIFGFTHWENLWEWLSKNEKLWGNKYGKSIFYNALAYDPNTNKYAKTTPEQVSKQFRIFATNLREKGETKC